MSFLEATEETVAGAPCVGEMTGTAEAPPRLLHPLCGQLRPVSAPPRARGPGSTGKHSRDSGEAAAESQTPMAPPRPRRPRPPAGTAHTRGAFTTGIGPGAKAQTGFWAGMLKTASYVVSGTTAVMGPAQRTSVSQRFFVDGVSYLEKTPMSSFTFSGWTKQWACLSSGLHPCPGPFQRCCSCLITGQAVGLSVSRRPSPAEAESDRSVCLALPLTTVRPGDELPTSPAGPHV